MLCYKEPRCYKADLVLVAQDVKEQNCIAHVVFHKSQDVAHLFILALALVYLLAPHPISLAMGICLYLPLRDESMTLMGKVSFIDLAMF